MFRGDHGAQRYADVIRAYGVHQFMTALFKKMALRKTAVEQFCGVFGIRRKRFSFKGRVNGLAVLGNNERDEFRAFHASFDLEGINPVPHQLRNIIQGIQVFRTQKIVSVRLDGKTVLVQPVRKAAGLGAGALVAGAGSHV